MNDKLHFPGWGVNRVKVDLESSEETLCFRAGVTLDGKLVGHAFNQGGGGPTHVTLTEAALKKIAKPAGIEDHVERLVENEVALQELAKTQKRWGKEIGAGCVYALCHDELKAQGTKAQEGKTGGPEENADYFRKKPSAEEVHRLEIGKILQRHLHMNLPLPATVRLEALKLLSEACVIIDDEDLSPAALLAYYIQYVVPELPLMPDDRTDELGHNQ